MITTVQSEIPKSALAVARDINTAEHYETFCVLFVVSAHLRNKVRPTRTGHLAEDCNCFPSFGVDVVNANIIKSDVVCFDINVVVPPSVNNKQLVLRLLIAQVSHLKLRPGTGWHTTKIVYLLNNQAQIMVSNKGTFTN